MKAVSPDNLFSAHSSPHSVDRRTGIIIFSEDIVTDESEIVQMSSEYHLLPYDQEYNDPVQIRFHNIDMTDDFWKYIIKYKEDNQWIEVDTKIEDDKIIAEIMSGGIYSVFYNPNAPNPIPEKFELVSLYPNPFNPILTIQYNLDVEQNISIDIYNILGQRVNKLFDQRMIAGYHSIQWNGRDNKGTMLGSGIYFIKISTKNASYVGKVSLIK